ncbi:MAG: Gfo/Idh/MocA family oxidoreductase [Thermoguttaceae bacterium]|jgi:predicted dehydrogenase|nr:Gfo/Idh/MocA family oxidoreductase [Thermoguttaceae bacterium]
MMDLSPEQREAGKRDFVDAINGVIHGPAGTVNRRDFIKESAAAGAVAVGGMGAFYFGYGASVANPVRVGVIGTGDEGNVLIGAINPDYMEVKAIADIRPYSIHRAFHGDVYSAAALEARPGMLTHFGWKTEEEARKHVKVYGPWQDLIRNARRDGLEAVIIALPLHLHAPAAICAMRAGLHVLTEKLMGHSVHECKEMARVAKETRKYLATGHQRHYSILYDNAVDQIKRGLLGDLHYIRAQWHRGNMPGTDSWQQPLPPQVKPEDPDAKQLANQLRSWRARLDAARGREIDEWRRKVAQLEAQLADKILHEQKGESGKRLAEEYGYRAEQFEFPGGRTYERPAIEELIRWRLWERTGGGLMAELGSHQLDAASIFVAAAHGGEKQLPLNVVAAGNRPIFGPDREADDHVYCIIEFPAPGYDPDDKVGRRKKIGMQYASINGNGFEGYGEIAFGTDGTLILEREQDAMLLQSAARASRMAVQAAPSLDTQASGPVQQAADGGPSVAVSRGYREQGEHWAWCIRNPSPQNQPRCHPKVALGDAVIALTTNLAIHQKERIEFDPAWFDPEDDTTPEGIAPDTTRDSYTL